MTAAVLKIPYFCPVVPDEETKLRNPREGTLEVLDEGNWVRPSLLVLFFAQCESFPSLGIQRSNVREFIHPTAPSHSRVSELAVP